MGHSAALRTVAIKAAGTARATRQPLVAPEVNPLLSADPHSVFLAFALIRNLFFNNK